MATSVVEHINKHMHMLDKIELGLIRLKCNSD